MPKTRTLEPEFWDDTVIDSLPIHERLLAAAMITLLADDEGRFVAEASVVKKKVFGADVDITIAHVEQMLLHISANWRNLKLYAVNGQRYGFLANFQKRQAARYVVKSKLPKFEQDSNSLPINESAKLPQISGHFPCVGLSRVEKSRVEKEETPPLVPQGEPSKTSKKTKTSREKAEVPEGYEPPPDLREKLKHERRFSDLQIDEETARFVRDRRAKGVRYKRVDLAWWNWLTSRFVDRAPPADSPPRTFRAAPRKTE